MTNRFLSDLRIVDSDLAMPLRERLRRESLAELDTVTMEQMASFVPPPLTRAPWLRNGLAVIGAGNHRRYRFARLTDYGASDRILN